MAIYLPASTPEFPPRWLQCGCNASCQRRSKNLSVSNLFNSLPKSSHKTQPSLDTLAFGGQRSVYAARRGMALSTNRKNWVLRAPATTLQRAALRRRPPGPTKFGGWFRGLNERPRTAQRPIRSLERQRTTTPVQRRRTTAAYSPICGSQVHPSQPESPSNLRRSHLTRFSLSADQSSSIAI